MQIRFTVDGKPKGQPRVRAYNPKHSKHAKVYDPGTANDWKSLVALAAKKVAPKKPITGPVFVDMLFSMPRPGNHHVSCDKSRPVKKTAPHYHVSKPDVDNLAKAVLDVLSDIGYWTDDQLVSVLKVAKIYTQSEYQEKPGVSVQVWPMNQPSVC